jgi:hypothetical protein
MKRSILSLAVASAALVTAGMANAALVAGPVNINPDAAGADPTILVGSLDWNVGNTIAIPIKSQSGYASVPAVGDQFQVFAQAALSAFNNQGGTGINVPGLNGAYEWTFVAGFVEEVVATTTLPSITTKAVTGGTNFFEIYFDTSPDANSLAGTGFNDGLRILSGTIAPTTGTSAGTFLVTGGGPGTNVPLDGFGGTDNYPDIDSITGLGSLALVINVNLATLNSSFFIDSLIALALDFSTQQNLNFLQTDPSAQLWDGSAFIPGATVASVGTCNGCVQLVNGIPVGFGPNNLFQLDPNNAFLVDRVPEPATLALMGLGLAGIGFSTRRRKYS